MAPSWLKPEGKQMLKRFLSSVFSKLSVCIRRQTSIFNTLSLAAIVALQFLLNKMVTNGQGGKGSELLNVQGIFLLDFCWECVSVMAIRFKRRRVKSI